MSLGETCMQELTTQQIHRRHELPRKDIYWTRCVMKQFRRFDKDTCVGATWRPTYWRIRNWINRNGAKCFLKPNVRMCVQNRQPSSFFANQKYLLFMTPAMTDETLHYYDHSSIGIILTAKISPFFTTVPPILSFFTKTLPIFLRFWFLW